MAICENFLREIWEHGVFWRGTSEQSGENFLRENSPIREGFLPQKFPVIQYFIGFRVVNMGIPF